MTTTNNAWGRASLAIQDDHSTLYRLDVYNGTRYSRRKDLTGVLELASRRFHEERKIYFVTALQDNVPFGFIEVNDHAMIVCFLDSSNRSYLEYDFMERQPNRLFLEVVQQWSFDDQSNVMTYKRSTFTKEGEVSVEEHNASIKPAQVVHSSDKIDVSSHWEDYPQFGQYESLLQIERVKNGTRQ